MSLWWLVASAAVVAVWVNRAKIRQAVQDRLDRRHPCKVCGSLPNERGHPCAVTVSTSRSSHRSRSGRTFYKRHHAQLVDPHGRFRCAHWHHTEAQAIACGTGLLRSLQTGGAAPGVYLTSVRRRRTRPLSDRPANRGPIAGLSPAEWYRLLVLAEYRCFYCKEQYREAELEREHMIPYARGGAHHRGNIVPSCRRCNREKGTLTAEQYLKLREDRQRYR